MFNFNKIAQELDFDARLKESSNLLNSIYSKINSAVAVLKELLKHSPSKEELIGDTNAINFDSPFYLERFKKMEEILITAHNDLDLLFEEAKTKRLDLEQWVLKPMKFFSALGSMLPTSKWRDYVPVANNIFSKLIVLKRISINNRRLNEKEFSNKKEQPSV